MERGPILAIDLGTQSLRLTAVAADGAHLWHWSRPVATLRGAGIEEQDAQEWRTLLLEGLREAAAGGILPTAIAACGVLAGYVPVDAAGEPLAPAVLYNDTRASAWVARAEDVLGEGIGGLRTVAADPLPQALRLAADAPDVFASTAHLLDATGWLNFVLTGEPTLNFYTALRLGTGGASAALGLPDRWFGRPTAIGERIGALRPALQDALGWHGVPVIAATFDSKCAYLGAGLAHDGDALDISGTVTSFGVRAARAVSDPARRVYSVPYGDTFLVRGSTAAAGSVLEWGRELLAVDFAALDALVAAAPFDPEGALLVPYHSGARAPLWQPHARGMLTGLSLSSGRAAVARAVYESLALSLRHIVETIEALDVDIGDIRLCGGLARNATLARLKADVLGKPVIVLAETELTTLGLAAIAGVALGWYPSLAEAARANARAARRFDPDPGRARYDRLFARYREQAELAADLASAPAAWHPPSTHPAATSALVN